MDRYLKESLLTDNKSKAILLSGPRQVGKTTLAKSLGSNYEYLNYDVVKDRKILMQQSWKKDAELLIFDELHKLRNWKNFLKGIIDQYQNHPPLIITGSARLDLFRKAGDALTGRTFSYRLHPIDLLEAKKIFPDESVSNLLVRLLKTGGFPESFLNPEISSRLLEDRLVTVLREDLADLSKINSVKGLELLIELLRERVGGQISYTNLAGDLGVSSVTVKNWLLILEKLYLTFTVTPYCKNLARSIRKEPKMFFYDLSAVYENTKNEGARLENLVACALLKYCHEQTDCHGRKLSLHYYRDQEEREVDFILVERGEVLAAIEVKKSEDKPTNSLKYFTGKARPKHAIQLVEQLDREQDYNGIKILDLSEWLSKISL